MPTNQLAIIWQGLITGTGLSGSYVVRCDNPEDFNRLLLADHWPPNAIVGLNDQTYWSKAAAYLEKLQAEVAART